MSSFTQEPHFEPIGSGYKWKVVRGFIYYTNKDAMLLGPSVFVPSGFVTDFASVPRILWPLFPPYGRYGKAAVVHDWLYAHKWLFDKNAERMKITKEQADTIFYEAMLVLDVPKWKAKLMYWAVKMFGKKAWGDT